MINRDRSKGITLVEVLIVAALLSILAIAGFSGWNLQISKARDAKRKADLQELRIALAGYYEDEGRYPNTEDVFCGATLFAPGMPEVPCDPVNTGNTVYLYESEAPDSYVIYVILEFDGDDAITEVGCEDGCGPGGIYNYFVASENLSIGTGGGEEGVLPTCPSSNAPANQRYCFANECSSCCPGQGYRCSRTGKSCISDSSCIPTPTPTPTP